MNQRQRAVLWLEAGVLVAMIAVPPYFGIDRESGGRVHSHLGYYALWNPPAASDVCRALREAYASMADCERRPGAFESGLNKVRLLLNAGSSLCLAAVLLCLFRERAASQTDGATVRS